MGERPPLSPVRSVLFLAIIGAVAGLLAVQIYDWINGQRAAHHGPQLARDASDYLALRDATERFLATLHERIT